MEARGAVALPEGEGALALVDLLEGGAEVVCVVRVHGALWEHAGFGFRFV